MREATESYRMAEGRALLTEREREALAGETSDSYRYKTRSYFRDRLEALKDDLTVLEKHDEELLTELRKVVCEGEATAEDGPAVVTSTTEPEPRTEPAPVPDPVADLDIEGSGSVETARKDALRDIVGHLREEGSAASGELKEIAAEYDDRFGYDNDVDNFWSNIRRQKVFDNLPVETPGQGGSTYTYTGEE